MQTESQTEREPETEPASPVRETAADSTAAEAAEVSTVSADAAAPDAPDVPAKPRRTLVLPSEVVYLFAVVLIAFAVSMTVTAGFGVSMIVGPAYLVSLRVPSLTFGLAEYVLQGILFVVFCLAVRRFKWVYLSSFVTCLLYGLILDGVQRFVPLLNPAVTAPESLPVPARLVLFAAGMVLTSFAIALFFKVYLYPQVYDFFVVGLVSRYHLKKGPFKTGFDLTFLALSVILSFALFGRLEGISWGTAVMAVCNGTIIGLFSKLFDRFLTVKPLFPKFAKAFEI